MKTIFLFFLLFLFKFQILHADLKEYFFSPFSKMKRLVFVEDFYEFYILNTLNPSSLLLEQQINYLKIAIDRAEKDEWWRHPSESFAYIDENGFNPFLNRTKWLEKNYKHYKILIKMNLYFFTMQSFLKLASTYDRQNLFWFHVENYSTYQFQKKYWPEDKKEHYLEKSFKIARIYYQEALKYWENTVSLSELYFKSNEGVFFYNDFMQKLENKAYQIYKQSDSDYKKQKNYFHSKAYPQYNYKKRILGYIENLDKKLKRLQDNIEIYSEKKALDN